MDTEKRLILCFALSMLIIFVFSWLNVKNAKERKPGLESTTPASATDVLDHTPTQAPVIAQETPPAEAAPQTASKPALEPTAWNWLPASPPESAPQEIVVESPLYQVTFSSFGAAPVSWKLLQFKELLEDPRYLELQATRGSQAKQQLAQLELNLYEEHKDNGPHYVEAIDSLFPEGRSGFQVKWGKDRNDCHVPYHCSQDRIAVDQATPVQFVYESNGLRIEKIYTFFADSYHFELEMRIVNQSGEDIVFG
ncbi:MAG: membrane protein insertase YidC, partial [Candidatus Hinthialibacter sp.]